ncbi:MAG: hypothetical protein CVV06_19400 [Gammaproteobacteria bacterium HGW-Gammaproteobacteria-10]|nr:MAG: hypothetical protein CVV06_19400 [Gammaproteobacteria bacterium HGW-Gammaproteobacteria-10]
MMNRTFNLKDPSSQSHIEVSRSIAFHEAGHAAAIHLGNQKKELPPVFFQICVKPLNTDFQSLECLSDRSARYMAKVEGGRLIHTIAASFHETTKYFSNVQKIAYQRAFEADIVNLLVGPLAEAKYIALRDNEPINPRLVNIEALQYYGGASDLELVNEYLDCFIMTRGLRERKLKALFMDAFSFINDRSNWFAITALADFVLSTDRNILQFEEIGSILDRGKLLTKC